MADRADRLGCLCASPKDTHKLTHTLPQRNLPSRGLFRPGPLIAGGSLIMLFGWYKLTVGIREQKYRSHYPSHHPPNHHANNTPRLANSPAKRCGPAST